MNKKMILPSIQLFIGVVITIAIFKLMYGVYEIIIILLDMPEWDAKLGAMFIALLLLSIMIMFGGVYIGWLNINLGFKGMRTAQLNNNIKTEVKKMVQENGNKDKDKNPKRTG